MRTIIGGGSGGGRKGAQAPQSAGAPQTPPPRRLRRSMDGAPPAENPFRRLCARCGVGVGNSVGSIGYESWGSPIGLEWLLQLVA